MNRFSLRGGGQEKKESLMFAVICGRRYEFSHSHFCKNCDVLSPPGSNFPMQQAKSYPKNENLFDFSRTSIFSSQHHHMIELRLWIQSWKWMCHFRFSAFPSNIGFSCAYRQKKIGLNDTGCWWLLQIQIQIQLQIQKEIQIQIQI